MASLSQRTHGTSFGVEAIITESSLKDNPFCDHGMFYLKRLLNSPIIFNIIQSL